MSTVPEVLSRQIDAAFDFRGHVTLALKDGRLVEGFLFNRQLAVPEPFVEVMLKVSGEKLRLAASELASVALTGEDCAAGKSYEDHLKKKAAGGA